MGQTVKKKKEIEREFFMAELSNLATTTILPFEHKYFHLVGSIS